MLAKNTQILAHGDFADLSAEVIELAGGMRFRAMGRSMLPTIHHGDVLTLVKVDAHELALGDVVLFRQGDRGRILAHRIVSAENGMFIACGDALFEQDEPFTAEQVIGRVTRIERHGKDRSLPRRQGQIMAYISRHSTELWARALKRLMRYRAVSLRPS